MKKRSPIFIVVLSIVTLGIYYLFWLADARRTLNEKTQIKIPTFWLIFVPVIATTVFGFVIGLVNIHNSTTANSNATNSLCNGSQYPSTASPSTICPPSTSTSHVVVLILIYVIVILLSIPVAFYWYYKFSKAVDAYTNKEINTILCFILLWLLSFIGAAILQDKFNDMVGGKLETQPTTPASVPSKYTPDNLVIPNSAQVVEQAPPASPEPEEPKAEASHKSKSSQHSPAHTSEPTIIKPTNPPSKKS